MGNQNKYWSKFLLSTVAFSAFATAPVLAQDSENLEIEQIADNAVQDVVADDALQDKIVVTGSRIKRSTFASIAPVQVISSEFSREIGLINSADILQNDSAASGQQVNDTFQGFVLDNGPGSQTISLRGLGAGRTLALINGRRMAPIGVEGAPADASVNFIPSSFISSYEILLDGASSVYGSDAVAGVVNAALRNDYDGFEVGGSLTNTQHGGGDSLNVYGSWGKQMDRGFFAVAVDYESQERLKLSQRDWSSECERIAEITESGQVRTTDLSNENDFPGMGTSSCDIFPLGSRISVGAGLDYGSLYYTPGFTNTGITNFSETSLYGVAYDGNGDGLADFSFYDYTSNGTDADRAADLISESSNLSAMVLADYQTDVLGDARLYTELSYFSGKSEALSPQGQLFQSVPGANPYNPCNPDGLNGQDCGAAVADYYNNTAAGQAQAQAFVNRFGGTPAQLDAFFGTSIAPGAIGAFNVQPIIGISGDRNNVESDLSQLRFVGGLEGALPFINYGPLTGWTYDASLTYSRSKGTSLRRGVREDRLLDSLNTSAIVAGTTNVVCGVDANNDGVPDGVLADGTTCVPVNLFADSLLGTPIGNLATEAERDYLFGERTFKTIYEQTLFQAIATGELFPLPGGTAAGVVGLDVLNDKLDSQPNDVASEGLFWGFFADRGAEGEMTTVGVYGELEMPILADQFLAKELSVNLSARHTATEFAGDANTFSVKLGWRPFDPLLLRGTYGTSFRAPNVREQFLEGQSGFATLADPCLVPEAAFDPIGGYDASQDGRDQTTLDNCVAAGLDPTTLGRGAFGASSVEVFQVGSNANPLKPEESESYSLGFVFEQPFTTWMDATLGATYYNLEITEGIRSQSPQFTVIECYQTVANLESPLCGNITRDTDGFLSIVNYEYENVAVERASGFDINLLVEKDFAVGSRDLDVSWDLRANKIETRNVLDRADDPSTYDSFVGEFYYPEWSFDSTLRLDYDDYRFTWGVSWQEGVDQDDEFVDPFSSFIDGGASVTCLGASFNDELCREIGFADAYATHNVSFLADMEDWVFVAGIRNLFDKEPPFVSSNEVFTASGTNYVPGAGYDALGRTFFINVQRQF